MGMELMNKVALITGATSGIGLATAALFTEKGAKVALLGRTSKDVEACAEKLSKKGADVLPIVADISQPKEMEAAYATIMTTWKRLDIVFANAGINGVWAPIDEIEPDEWDQTLDINLKGTFLTVKYAVPHLKNGGGAIIITSSVNGTRMFSNTGATAYACSKAAQVAFAKMVALELAPEGIRVNVICPGAIETEIEENTEKKNLDAIRYPVEFPKGQVPLTQGKPGSSEQVAELVLFLASEAASHISGTEIWIDGAQSLLQG
jgi:NAD(P)-dependent dehydrogenase (short-subunit alcohol dehydrogenase family)